MYHLRDALRTDRVVLDTTMKLTFFPLLKSIDSDLFQHLVGQGVDDIKKLFSFIIYVISNWFATDMVDIASASRLIDVFIVSHPTTPIYSTIAILVYFRETILSSSDMNRTVRTLPLFQLDSDKDGSSTGASLETVEEIITMTIGYMYVIICQSTVLTMSIIPLFSLVNIFKHITLYRKLYRPGALMELNVTAAIWSDETRIHLLDNACSISMLNDTPPIWCITDTSPNEWTIIQNAIRGTTSEDNTASNAPSDHSMAQHPLAFAALDIEMPLSKPCKGKATIAYRNALVPLGLVAVFTFALVQYGTFLPAKKLVKTEDRAFVVRRSSNEPDAITCLESQLLECSSVGIVSNIHDVAMDKMTEPQVNESWAFSEVFLLEDKPDGIQEMIVPSTTPLANIVIEYGDSPYMNSISDNVAILKVEATAAPQIVVTMNNITDFELVFAQNILDFVQLRTSKIERRLHSFVTSPMVSRLRQIIESQIKRVNAMRNVSNAGFHAELSSDVELAFEQNIIELCQRCASKMKSRLKAILSSSATQHLQQTLASQIANVGSKLHSQIVPGANAVRASQLYSKEGTFLLSYEQRRVY